MVFRVVTLEVVVKKKTLPYHTRIAEYGKVDYLCFYENFFTVVKLHTCLNIILVFYITEHENLPIYSTDKFTHRLHFANSAVCCRFLRFHRRTVLL